MLITIRPADDHPADYILAAADAPAEWVRVTPDALPGLVLALPEARLNDEENELLRVFGDTEVAHTALHEILAGGCSVSDWRKAVSRTVTTTIELADWHRLRMGDRAAAPMPRTVDEIIEAQKADIRGLVEMTP